jgi:hypothetical protein
MSPSIEVSVSDHHSTIDDYHLAGYVCRQIRSQKQHGSRDILGPAQSAQRDLL